MSDLLPTSDNRPLQAETPEGKGLTEAMKDAAAALAGGSRQAEAAEVAHTTSRTVRRWLQRPAFRRLLQSLQVEAYEATRAVYGTNAEKLAWLHVAIALGQKPRHDAQLRAIEGAVDRALGSGRHYTPPLVGMEHTAADGSTYRVLIDYRDGQAPRWLTQGRAVTEPEDGADRG